ncbi:S8 family serine peptidase [Phytohabitans suffuscus]|uniref:Peptidase S8/S53 domain-containing protein n=1 Tax=Phytohabitans suffuscus TaxID=624315 RepID=A0A6F8Y9W8_9ACTN|nr:S8 family serine peptidase [Phytohabitans suffuscus]BCB82895.1 hypothetical protein Psuf_002080 [Phytohabitans suffuscus]
MNVPARQMIRFAHVSSGASFSAARVAAPQRPSREWAWGGSTGEGVRVCVIDSGVDPAHPLVGGPVGLWAVEPGDGDVRFQVEPDDAGDLAGHGTACAGIIRTLAPACQITSVRVLGRSLRGSGEALLVALEWAIEQGFDLVNLSLSTRQAAYKEWLHDLADAAYHRGVTLVSSAHNSPVTSYPWRFPSVISVGSHGASDPWYLEANPAPPVDFFAHGVGVRVAWSGGGTRVVSGNSFATPHVTGLCALVRQRHPQVRTSELRHLLRSIADNLVEEQT